MAEKLLDITKVDTPYIQLKVVDTLLNELDNQNWLKGSKVDQPTNKKSYFKTLKTSVINSPISHQSLIITRKELSLNFTFFVCF